MREIHQACSSAVPAGREKYEEWKDALASKATMLEHKTNPEVFLLAKPAKVFNGATECDEVEVCQMFLQLNFIYRLSITRSGPCNQEYNNRV